MYVIWSIEHHAWWRPARWGYCHTLAEAGRYSQAEAERILAQANRVAFNECMIPVDALSTTTQKSDEAEHKDNVILTTQTGKLRALDVGTVLEQIADGEIVAAVFRIPSGDIAVHVLEPSPKLAHALAAGADALSKALDIIATTNAAQRN